jgi:hypothetical protein
VGIGWRAGPLAAKVQEDGALLGVPVLAVHPVALFVSEHIVLVGVVVIDVIHEGVL